MIKTLQRVRDKAVLKLYHLLKITEGRERERHVNELIATFKKCGKDVHIESPIRLSGGKHLEIGDNVHIGENAFIRADGGLTIGDNTMISRNLLLYSVNHNAAGERLPYDAVYLKKPVVIGRNVWIGMNVCIAPGTVIGDGAIIGMGTTVSGVVPPGAIIGSQKWRIIGQRDPEHYNQLEEARLYSNHRGQPFESSSS
ncbi:acyltransferase [bacterium]|nr:MAG: acyltransferase [bacterium]